MAVGREKERNFADCSISSISEPACSLGSYSMNKKNIYIYICLDTLSAYPRCLGDDLSTSALCIEGILFFC